MKLNHCLSDSGTTQHEGYMQLSEDGDLMEITKKLPLKKMYMKSADDWFIEREQKKMK